MRGTWFWSMLWYATFWLSIIYHVTLQAYILQVDKSDIIQRVQTESKYLHLAPLYCVFLVTKRHAFAPWEQAVWWALCKGWLQACFKFLLVIMQEPSSSFPGGSGLPGGQEKNTRLAVRFGGWFFKSFWVKMAVYWEQLPLMWLKAFSRQLCLIWGSWRTENISPD